MKRHAIHTLLLTIVWACASLTVLADGVIRFPRDSHASVAVVVRDLATGEDLVSQNPHRAMIPASTLKCVTTAASLRAGSDTTHFATDVYLLGEVMPDGILDGYILVKGIGDPTIDSRQFPDNPSLMTEILEALKARGIKRITGGVAVDEDAFPEGGPCEGWQLSDTAYDYGAGLYALNFRDNCHGSRAMRAPDEEFGNALEALLNSNGITLDWDEVVVDEDNLTLLCTHHSPRGREILRNMMRRSDNLFAEGMLRKLAPGQGYEQAVKREKALLADSTVSWEVEDIFDGSGLSRNNRLSALTLTEILATMACEPGAEAAYADLFPVVGREGTVKSLLADWPKASSLRLKSGSMRGVHCYAGYRVDGEGKPTHSIVIFVNDFICKRDAVRTAIENFLKKQFSNV